MIFYLDMDGVLAGFDEHKTELGYGDTREDAHEAMRVPGFFRDLKVLPGAHEGVARLEKVIPGRVCILSAVTKSDPHYAEIFRKDKLAWLSENFPTLASSAKIVTDKSTVGTSDDVLVDDHPDWNGAESFPGMIIHFAGPSTWDEVIAEAERRKHSLIRTSKLFRNSK